MEREWRYRVSAVIGSALLTAVAVVAANNPFVQANFAHLPLIGHLPTEPAWGPELGFEALTTMVVVLAALFPLYKPHQRRILDVLTLAQKRILLALVTLAAIGYFDYSYRLPRATLILVAPVLFVFVPAWLVAIRLRQHGDRKRALLIGDDPDEMESLLEAADIPVVGYVSPPARRWHATDQNLADGGVVTPRETLDDLELLGGLSRLDEVLVTHDIDTALLAFSRPDRSEFFGALDACYDHGVAAKVHRDHADAVLTRGAAGGDIVDVDLEPWDWEDHVVKRGFDVAFALTGLFLLSPVIAAIAAAIKLDSDGPLLYSQERTAEFGDTFTVHKFRSMVTDAEAETGAKLSEEDDGGVDPRVTRVGRVLRQTHLDEIPQLWSVLVGDMSVVGPRPERPELDTDMETGVGEWRRRWFVKPGLTGLAQVNGATGYDPEKKLRYDIEYIRKQSFWFDLKLVTRQIWLVLEDLARL